MNERNTKLGNLEDNINMKIKENNIDLNKDFRERLIVKTFNKHAIISIDKIEKFAKLKLESYSKLKKLEDICTINNVHIIDGCKQVLDSIFGISVLRFMQNENDIRNTISKTLELAKKNLKE